MLEGTDGISALSEHKAQRVGNGNVVEAALGGVELSGYVQAAFHPGESGPGYWAIELATSPELDPADSVSLVDAVRAQIPPEAPWALWVRRSREEVVADALGLEEVRGLYEMQRPLPLDETPDPGADVVLSRFRPGQDEAAWLELNNLAFAGHPENAALTREDLADRMNQVWFDPDGLLMARSGGRLVASCWTKVHDSGIGEIYIVAVHPQLRGIGLGRAVVVAGLDDLWRRRQVEVASLWVESDNESALKLYRDIGFEPIRSSRLFRLPD